MLNVFLIDIINKTFGLLYYTASKDIVHSNDWI